MLLRLAALTPEDSGEVRCEVRTALDSLRSAPASLTVATRTRIVEFTAGKVELVAGRTLELECRAEADPRLAGGLQLAWTHNGSLVSDERSGGILS